MSSLLAKVNSANSPLNGSLVEDAGLTFLGRAAAAPIACTPAVTPAIGVTQAINNCDEIQCETCSDSSLCDSLTIITT